MEINNSVAAWSAGLAAQRLPRWDELPDIDLYLDQVLTLRYCDIAEFALPACRYQLQSASLSSWKGLPHTPAALGANCRDARNSPDRNSTLPTHSKPGLKTVVMH